MLFRVLLSIIIFALLPYQQGWSQCTPTFASNTTNSVCKNSSLTFTISNFDNTYTYQWQRNWQPIGGNGQNQTIPFTTVGNTPVSVIANDGAGCIDTTTINITVNDLPTADFTFTPDNQCSPMAVSFTNTSTGATPLSYTWFEGGNTFSSGTNPSRTFDEIGGSSTTKQVSLQVTDGNGCVRNSPVKNITVKERPHAALLDTAFYNFGLEFTRCDEATSVTVGVENQSTTQSTNSNYHIDWGDNGATYSGTSIPYGTAHTYTNLLGYTTIALTVDGNNGCQSTTNYQMFNGGLPSIGLSYNSITTYCAPKDILFPIDTSTTNQNTPGTTYLMEFDDGTPSITFQHPVPPSYTHTFWQSSCGNTAQFLTQNVPNAFSISMTASNACGNSYDPVGPIRTSSPPSADFTYTSTVCAGTPVTFTNASDSAFINLGNTCNPNMNKNWSVTPTTGVTVNGSSNGETFSATFSNQGTYDVRLIVSNPCGSDTIIQQICIVPVPDASFDVGTNSQADTVGCVPFTVSAVSNTSNTVNQCSEIYSWSISMVNSACANTSNQAYSFTNGTDNASQNPQIEFTEPGVYNLTLLINNECNDNSTFTRTIIVQDEPNFSLANISDFCQNDSINPIPLSVTICHAPISTWQWTTTGGGAVDFPNQENPGYIHFNSFGSKTITATATNACGSTTRQQTFSINQLPTLPTLSANEPCEGQTLNITQSGGSGFPSVTYFWQHPQGNSVNTNLTFNNAQTNRTGTYLLTSTLTDGTGCADTVSIYTTVNPLPTLNLTASDPTPCAFDNISITATGATTYSWVLDNYTSTDNPISLSPTQDTTYTVTGTDDNGCQNTQSIFINTTDLPTVSGGGNLNPCFQTPAIPIQLNGFPNGGQWSPVGSIAPNTLTASGQFTPNAIGAVDVIYSYTDPNTNCTNTDIVNLNVVIPQTADAGADMSACAGDPVISLVGSPNGGIWTDGNGAQVTEFNPTTQGTYTFTYSYGSGSCENSDNMTITVNPLPTVTVQSDFALCANVTPVDITENVAGGTWSSNVINTGLTNTNTGMFDPSQSNAATEILTYTYIENATGCQNSDAVTVTIHPVTIADAGQDQTICNVTTNYQLTGYSPSGGTWSGNGFVGGSTDMFNSNGVTGVYTLVYSFTNSNNCTDTNHVVLTVEDIVVPIINNDTAVCRNTSPLPLIADVSGGTWRLNGFPYNGTTFNPTTAGTYTFTYTIEENTTCEASDNWVITVYDLPAITVNPPLDLCEDAAIVNLTESPSGGTWSGNGITNTSTGQFDVNNFSLTGSSVNTTATYTFTDANQCTDSGLVNIAIHPLPTVEVQDSITYCEVQTNISISSNVVTPTNGTWSGTGIVNPNGSFNAFQNGANGLGLYYPVYSFTDNNSCTNTDTLQIRVEEADSISAGFPDTVCIDAAPFTLTDFYPTTGGIWSGIGITNASTGAFSPTQAGVGLKTLTFSYGTGTCTINAQKTVLVVDTPTVFAGNDQTACLNEPAFQLQGYSPQTGDWTGNNVTSGGEFTPSATGTFTLTYTVVEDVNGCTNFDTKDITIHPLPVIDAGLDTVLCNVNQTVDLPNATANVSGTGVWTTSNGASGIVNSTTLSVNPAVIGIDTLFLIYTFTDVYSCSVEDSIKLEVNSPVNIDAGIDTSLCINTGLYTFVAVEPTGGTWTSIPANAVTPNGVLDSDNLAAGNYTLIYEYDDGNGTCIVSDGRVVTILPRPVVNAGIDETICIETPPFALSGYSPTTGGTGTWTGNGVDAQGTFSADIAGVNATPHTLTYTFVDNNSCENSDTKNITVVDLPVIDSLVGPDTLCNQPFGEQYYGYQNTGATNDGTWTGTNITSNGIFTPNGTGDFTIKYCYTDNNQCENCDSMVVTVTAPFNIDAGANDTFCFNTGTELIVPIEPTGGTWSSPNSVILSDGTFNTNITPNTYSVTYTVGGGTCLVSDTKTITVRDTPTVFAGNDEMHCIETPPFALTNYSPLTTSLGTGTWTGNGITDSLQGIFSSDVAGVNATPHVLTYHYIDTFGCENSDTKTILVVPLPVIDSLTGADTLCNQPIGSQYIGYQNEGSPNDGTWSGDNITPNGVFTPNGTGDFTIKYCYTNSNQCENCDSMVVSVIAPFNIEAGANDTFCFNTGMELIVPIEPTGGIWTSPNSVILSDGTFNTNIAPNTYAVTYSFGGGTCLVSDTKTITVRDTPTVFAGNDEMYCIETPPFALTNYSPVTTPLGTGTWSGNGIIDSLQGIFSSDAAGVNATPHVLTYHYIDTFGCENSDTKTILVVPLPVIDSLVGMDTLCNQPIGAQYTGYQNEGSPNDGVWSGTNISPNGLFTPNGTGDFTIKYCYINSNQCENCDSIVVTVVDPLPIEAGQADTICIDEGIHTLTAETPPGGIWINHLAIGNAQTGTFDPILATRGWHTVTYQYGSGTCLISDTTGVYVRDLWFVDAGADQEACDTDADFAITGFSPTGGVWSGTGISDPVGTFSPISVSPNTYPITYLYTDPVTLCDTSRVKNVTIHPLAQPDFSADTVLCLNVPFSITDLSTNTITWQWNFGDGNSDNVQNPTHTYTNTGHYTIQLIATSVHGCIDSTTLNVYVTEPPTAYFVKDTSEGCAPLPVNFTDSSTGDFIVYDWDFGNGNIFNQAQPPTQIYYQGTSDTTYYITLTTSNLCGQTTHLDSVIAFPTPQIAFSPDVFSGCTPLTVDFWNNTLGEPDIFYWDFGNGLDTTYNTNTISHIFYTDTAPSIYQVILIAENDCGFDTASTTITVNPVTVESFFNVDTTVGCMPLTIQFSDYSTPGTTIVYDFGDGGTGTTGDTAYTFQQAGLYKAVQYVTNGCGYDSTFVWINVLPAPTASFTSVSNECEDLPIVFTNTSQNTTGQSWDFGDGNTSSASPVSHIFTSAGTYSVTLTVYADTSQCPGSISKDITVLPKPIADLDVSTPTVCLGEPITLNDNSTGSIVGIVGELGDGNTFTSMPHTHTYADTGGYQISYHVIDANACVSDTISEMVYVYPLPTSAFAFEILDSCVLPTAVAFTNLSEGAVGYEWTLGNGQMLTINNPTVTYNFGGMYEVNLVAISAFGCLDSSQQQFKLFEVPTADFDFTQNNQCEPSLVQFNNTSINATSFYWDLGNGTTSTIHSPIEVYERGVYDVSLIVGIDSACYDTLALTGILEVYPSPTAHFTWADTMIDDRFKGVVQFRNHSIDATQYHWDFDDNSISNEEHPVHYFQYNDIFNVVLTAINEYDCADTTTQPINPAIFGTLAVPNVFAPEFGIGDDAKFIPRGIGIEQGTFIIEVFDKGGERVWFCDELDEEGSPNCSWDGKYLGNYLPQGAYAWRAEATFLNGSAKRLKGTVTIIR